VSLVHVATGNLSLLVAVEGSGTGSVIGSF